LIVVAGQFLVAMQDQVTPLFFSLLVFASSIASASTVGMISAVILRWACKKPVVIKA